MAKSKKRILIFSTAYHPFVGGAEIAVKEITDRLGSSFSFDLITAKMSKENPVLEKIGNVNIYRIGLGYETLDKILLPFSGALKAFSLDKKNNYYCFWGIMVTFGSGAGFISNILNRVLRRRKVPIVLTLQEGDSEEYLKYKWAGLINLSWRLALFYTDALTALSSFLVERAKRFGFKGKSYIVPNGVDLSLYSKEVGDDIKNKVKENIGKKEEDVFLVTTSRLVHKNATDDIVSALTKLPPNVKLLVIGKGREGMRLHKQTEELNLKNRVKFLGFIPYSKIPDYLSVCDIFVRPSRSEGFGNSFIEAMAANLPVIATPIGGIVDFLTDKETGIFCSPDSPESIAKSVDLLIKDKELAKNITEKAKRMVFERYSWDKVAKDMKAVFDIFDKSV